MYAFGGMGYDSAMSVPIPIRKWLIKRWNTQKERENGTNKKDVNEPLKESEKVRELYKSKQAGNQPPSNFMQSVRNRK